MKICIVGKYPPIEGGVSTQTFWLARGLARRGHEVHVVTNADEVEDNYRMSLCDEDAGWREARFPETGGLLSLYSPAPFRHDRMAHIPVSNPFVSKLASVATDVVRRHGCEHIIGSYFEPYGVAAWMAAKWTDRPLSLKHAGSDLDRLFAAPDLATTYKEILRDADNVVTQQRLMPRFIGMGVAPERLRRDPGFNVPAEVFSPDAEPLDVGAVALPELRPAQAFDPALPTLGALGKIGLTKGTFDLIAALSRLAREGLAFQFVAMVGAAQGEMLRPHLERAGLMDRTWILPLLPNWRVPGMMRACTAICFLERDFPVVIHGPMVPREVLACGVCLVLSAEIADKQRYRDRLKSGENVVIVDDPKDQGALAEHLRPLIVVSGMAQEIGRRGGLLSREIEGQEDVYSGWENILTSPGDPIVGDTRPARVLGALDYVLPGLTALLRERQPGLVEDFLDGAEEGSPFTIGVAFCEFTLGRLDPARIGETYPVLADAVRYGRARLTAAHDAAEAGAADFCVVDRLRARNVTADSAGRLHPLLGHSVEIETFGHDVSAVFVPGAPPEEAIDLATIQPEDQLVLFQRAPNLTMRELRIDAATKGLVQLCDGAATTSELVETMKRRLGSADADADVRAILEGRIYDALDRLYSARVIVFGERTAAGWSGGQR